MSKKIERMKVKKQQIRESHLECHQRLQGLPEHNGVPFDDEWEEESKENSEDEGLGEIPVEAVGEGDIVDE
ncbi:hypothetical protein F511_38762 [Dorcoceras hygrometricum]|uniref:Uncharacterized protein n=1 Tax=Dorcoceras hygrometricum TaxID=472368 RepID=A0A2Z7CMZ3_9LAMI|nr:hypothetical protein F511_38762 [Dorcoceras hygrometricum]